MTTLEWWLIGGAYAVLIGAMVWAKVRYRSETYTPTEQEIDDWIHGRVGGAAKERGETET